MPIPSEGGHGASQTGKGTTRLDSVPSLMPSASRSRRLWHLAHKIPEDHYQSAPTSVSYQRGCTPHHRQAITSLRDDLHWLPFRQRTQFKLCSLISKCPRRRVRRRRIYTWPTCASQCRGHPAALVCVLPFTAISSSHGLAWPAMGLAVSPSRVR